MNQLKKTILLALSLPILGIVIIYQIDPDLLDPSAEGSLLSFMSSGGTTANFGQIDIGATNAPTQILGLIMTSLTGDSLSTSTGNRDPMVPLVSLRQDVGAGIRRSLKPVRQARFPVRGSDINAIFYRSNSPQVLIKGKRYEIGSVIQDAEITAINQSSVVFKWRGQSITLEKARRGLGG